MNRKFKGGGPGRSAMRAVRRAVIQTAIRPAAPIRVVPNLIRNAHNLMGEHSYNDAGTLFEQLANNLHATGEKRAPQFYVQAGRARLMGGELLAGMALLKVGLSALTNNGNFQQVLLMGQRLIEELTQQGHNSEAAQIQEMLDQNIPLQAVPAAEAGANGASVPALRLLPTNCPSCGGPLIPKEVEWMDAFTAECPYCGNGVRVETEEPGQS